MARKLRPEERALWEKVAETATPMRSAGPLSIPRLALPKSLEARSALIPPKITDFKIGAKAQPKQATAYIDSVSKLQLKMDAKAYGKLTRGKLNPEARLDLHGMTMSEAYPVLQNFILRSAQLQRRLVLVITGKGKSKSDRGLIPERHGVLRHNVPLWLRQAPLVNVILETTLAHQRHGGAGALYIYLRRNR